MRCAFSSSQRATVRSSSASDRLGGGAGSPQELADALGTINGMADIPTLISLGRPLDTVDGLSPGLRSAAEAVIGFFGALGELDGLTQEKWGRSLNEIDDLGNGMGDSIQLPQSAVVDVVSGNLGQLTVTMQDGSEEVVEIIEIGGRWYLDQSDPMGGNPFMSMDGGMGGGGEGMDNEMAMQMAETMSEMIVGMFQGMEQIMRQLSSEVRDGSLATFDDLDARGEALADELMGDMMPGGMPGGGGFPGGGG